MLKFLMRLFVVIKPLRTVLEVVANIINYVVSRNTFFPHFDVSFFFAQDHFNTKTFFLATTTAPTSRGKTFFELQTLACQTTPG